MSRQSGRNRTMGCVGDDRSAVFSAAAAAAAAAATDCIGPGGGTGQAACMKSQINLGAEKRWGGWLAASGWGARLLPMGGSPIGALRHIGARLRRKKGWGYNCVQYKNEIIRWCDIGVRQLTRLMLSNEIRRRSPSTELMLSNEIVRHCPSVINLVLSNQIIRRRPSIGIMQ